MDLVMTLVPSLPLSLSLSPSLSRPPAGFLDGVSGSRQHHGASKRQAVTRFLKGQLTLSERTEGLVPAAHNELPLHPPHLHHRTASENTRAQHILGVQGLKKELKTSRN